MLPLSSVAILFEMFCYSINCIFLWIVTEILTGFLHIKVMNVLEVTMNQGKLSLAIHFCITLLSNNKNSKHSLAFPAVFSLYQACLAFWSFLYRPSVLDHYPQGQRGYSSSYVVSNLWPPYCVSSH